MDIRRTMAAGGLALALLVGGAGCSKAAEKAVEKATGCEDVDASGDEVGAECDGNDVRVDDRGQRGRHRRGRQLGRHQRRGQRLAARGLARGPRPARGGQHRHRQRLHHAARLHRRSRRSTARSRRLYEADQGPARGGRLHHRLRHRRRRQRAARSAPCRPPGRTWQARCRSPSSAGGDPNGLGNVSLSYVLAEAAPRADPSRPPASDEVGLDLLDPVEQRLGAEPARQVGAHLLVGGPGHLGIDGAGRRRPRGPGARPRRCAPW